ncbi:NnrS family protein [Chelativorans sp. AA-79]|uniref:NnrS family protein n=1 Tax=Chelativorans sp. AA-79 TaxID=3028735 RepID=UPI0023F9E68F|nr:NnrS family protein [Chelativorans sp. AA-79]WEX08544.1 NnrS family protein [Chelativorans sp. AA-79]
MTVLPVGHGTFNAGAVHPLLSEGLRLFFPLAAIHAMAWPTLWVIVFAFDLPLARSVPPGQWHAYEMIFGTYGAALAGFLTSAVPEWTDTRPRQGASLVALFAFWLPGRLVGLLGADALMAVAAITDFTFLSLLMWFAITPMIERRSTRHASFVTWIVLLAATEAAIRMAWISGQFDLSARLLQTALLIFVLLFALALSRINVVVLNLALDPSGETTPYRPHPGRQNLAAAATALFGATSLAFPGSQAPAFLALAAGAAFMDRLGEWFIGRGVLKGEVLALALANLFAALGLITLGLADLGVAIPPAAGLHLLSVGALGTAVIAVFIIAGLRHTGRLLVLPWQANAAIVLIVAACLVRVLPEVGVLKSLFGPHYTLATLLWAGTFGIWLAGFLPFLVRPGLDQVATCGSKPGYDDTSAKLGGCR